MKQVIGIWCAFLFPLLTLLAQGTPQALYTYIGKPADARVSLRETEQEAQLHGARVAVRLGDLLILKSPVQLDVPFQKMELFKPGDALQPRSAEDDLLSQLLQWTAPEHAEAAFLEEITAHPCGESCGCIPAAATTWAETSAGGLSLVQNPDGKRVLMCYSNPWVLCDTAAWMTVLKQVDIIKIYIGDINERVNPEQASCLVKALLDNNIKIAVEIGGLLDWHADKKERSAEFSFQQEWTALQPLINLIKSFNPEKSIDMLDFDGPIRRMLFPNNIPASHHTLRSAMDELFKVLRLWKDAVPGIEVNLLTNFPNWAWGTTPAYFNIGGQATGYGNYQSVMNELRARNRDTYYRFDGLTIDNPYDYATGTAQSNQPDRIRDVDWLKRLLELESNARLLGLKVNMIFNTAGARTDSAYSAQTLAYIDLYRNAGGRPDGYWIQSWYDKPQKWIPEEAPYSMTNLVKAALPYAQIRDLNPSRTSDYMRGTSTAAIFFVQNTTAGATGAAAWNEAKQNASLANIAMNLAWWTDVAAAFGVEKSFVVETYGYTHPAVQVDFDPTQGYTGTATNDSRFQTPIMAKLGYTQASVILAMRAFAHDLRLAKGTDWAFCAFILEGDGQVRPHASLQGPSTVLTRASTVTGSVFAHEVGHIYGAYDEYWEAGATFRDQQTRYGVRNGNFHWRNYPVQPSMMASSFSGGISYYTAVHLGLTNQVQLTRVQVTPPDAIFEVAYATPNGVFGSFTRYQGAVDFHWGEGMRVRLRAPEEAYSGGVVWETPSWSAAGNSPVITFQKNSQTPAVISLAYRPSGRVAQASYQYLHVGNALASPDVYAIIPSGSRVGFAGTRGLSVWDGSTRYMLDMQTAPGAVAVPYDSRAGAAGARGDVFFSTLSGDVTALEGNRQTYYTPGAATSFRIIARTADGTIWAGVGADARGSQGETSPSGLSSFGAGRYQVLRTTNSNIPSNYVSGLAAMPSGTLLVSFFGPSDAESGLYEYDPVLQTWKDLSDQLPNRKISKLREFSTGAIAQHGSGFSIITSTGIAHVQPILPAGTSVFDFVLDAEGNMYYATGSGVYVFDERQVLRETFTMANSMIPTNTIFSIALTEAGNLLLGTVSGAVLIGREQTVTSVRRLTVSDRGALQISPNPASEYIDLWLDRLSPTWAPGASADVLLFNSQGVCVQRAVVPPGAVHYRMLTAHLPAGMYVVKAGTAVGRFVVSR